MDPERTRKIKLSVIIGFLTIALFTMLGTITSAAAGGNPIAKWVLLLIFGAIAVLLASYAIGYIILTIISNEPVLETPQPQQEVIPRKKATPKRRAKKRKARKKRKR